MIQGAALDKRDRGAVLVALSSTLRGETEGALAMDEDEVKEGCVRTPLEGPYGPQFNYILQYSPLLTLRFFSSSEYGFS